jgi:hypothetical protein
VLRTAALAADLLGDTVLALHVADGTGSTARSTARWAGVEVEDRTGDPVEEIIDRAGRPEVELVVLAARNQPAGARPAGHVAVAVLERSAKPVLVVPPDARLPVACGGGDPSRLLMPLDGAPDSARGLAALAAGFGTGESSSSWSTSSSRSPSPASGTMPATPSRSAPTCSVNGGAPRRVLSCGCATAHHRRWSTTWFASERADCIALVWFRRLEPGRAAVVREVLEGCPVPVLLIPTPTRPAASAREARAR